MNDVQSWMSRDPETLEPDASALDAFDRMLNQGFRHLPVVTHKGELVGIVSSDDLRAALPFDAVLEMPLDERRRAIARHYRIDEVMTYFPITVHPGTSLAVAASTLMDRHIGALPVVDRSGKLTGIFTETDALRALLDMLRGPAESPPARTVTPAPEAITRLADELRMERERIARRLGGLQQDERSLGAQQHEEPDTGSDRGALHSAGILAGALADSAAHRLAEIDGALERHRRGALGICVVCAQPIPLARLRALPGTERCIRCAKA